MTIQMEETATISAEDQTPLAEVKSRQTLIFSGSGKEYFRIWIVNLCLSIATIGIYSAWAKVRRLQYFDRNTQLAGASFNFHGNPIVILRGRIIAVILLFFYNYVFELSENFAIFFVVALFFTLPLMMRSAQRFRLRNSSYRGLYFDFDGSIKDAYLTYLPLVAVFLFPPLLAVLYPFDLKLLAASSLLYLLWPVLQARMKRYQHGNFTYGQINSTSNLGSFQFISPYIVAGFYTLLVGILVGVVTSIFTSTVNEVKSGQFMLNLVTILYAAIVGLLVYSVFGPFLQAKIWNASWSSTRLGNIEFQSNIPIWGYTKLQLVNAILTIVSLGLFRPFAVVRIHQFRLQHMAVICLNEDLITQQKNHLRVGAVGESSADFFGFDLSW